MPLVQPVITQNLREASDRLLRTEEPITHPSVQLFHLNRPPQIGKLFLLRRKDQIDLRTQVQYLDVTNCRFHSSGALEGARGVQVPAASPERGRPVAPHGGST